MPRLAPAFWLLTLATLALGRHSGTAASEPLRLRGSHLPLAFEPNVGQAPHGVRFVAHVGKAVALLSSASIEAFVPDGSGGGRSARLRFVGARAVEGEPVEPLPGTANYFIGADPRGWHTGIPTSARVRFAGVWPGIDLVFRGERGALEFDFVVHPGADPAAIRLELDEPALSEGGALLFAGGFQLLPPSTFEAAWWGQRAVGSRYALDGRAAGFELEAWDPERTVVIDPVLTWSTFLGGSGGEHAQAVAVSSTGEAVFAGYTASPNFPLAGAVQGTNGGGSSDAFVTRVNAAGTALVHSTYLGGSFEDSTFGVAVDGVGNVWLVGRTYSNDWPTASALQANRAGSDDAFAAKLNPAGSSLLFSSYLGGTGSDSASAVGLDSAGAAYLTGFTSSTNFPTTGALQSTSGGGNDAFVAKLAADGSARVYSTFLGGNGDDYGNGIAVDTSGSAYVTGHTTSTAFPRVNAYQTSRSGADDAFISKVSSAGSSLVYSTYLGGTGSEYGNAIAVDSDGTAVVAGSTSSTNFPTVAAPQPTFGGGTQDAFVTRLAATGSALASSTFLGGNQGDRANGVAIDGPRGIAVTGFTGSANFPLVAPVQPAFGGGTYDAFVTQLTPGGSTRLWSTFLGGTDDDFGNAVAVDSSGNIFVAGTSASADFPLAAPLFPTYGGGIDDGVAIKLCCTFDGGFPDAGFQVPDAGFPDAGFPDAGFPDAGFPDAGFPDAGFPDAGFPDAGFPDAGFPDAGFPDAGFPDAGFPDAGSPDAGLPDAGLPDGGTSSDGGGATLRIVGTPPTMAPCSVRWSYAPLAEPAASWVWTALEAPDGFNLDASSGAATWTPAPRQRGDQPVAIQASSALGVVEQRFTVAVECPGELALQTGCSCTGGGGALAAWAWLALLSALRRRRTRR